MKKGMAIGLVCPMIRPLGMLAWMPGQAQQKNIILDSSTNTQGSGHLDVLLSTFERRPAIL